MLLLTSVEIVTEDKNTQSLTDAWTLSVCEHVRDSRERESERERGATFIVIRGVPRGETKVVLIVCPLIQRPGWSVSYTEAVLVC